MSLSRLAIFSSFRAAVRSQLFKPTFAQKTTFSTAIRTMANEYKLKGLTSIDLKNGQKQEAEVEGIEGGKVLLVKVKDEIHAMSANCTHYGAPLKLGVVTGEGRLTCAWHGACFDIATGDVEDAPALDPLAKFKIIQKDGAVYIVGDEATIKANRRNLSIKCAAKGSEKVLIVGGGSGALGAIEGLRGGGFNGHITVINPSTDYLQGSNEVKLEKDGSVRVDESFAVPGLKDVFAIGDIATYPYHGPGGDGQPTRIEHWNVAQNAGRSVARSINDPSAKPKAFIPIFWSALGSQLRYCGNTVGGYDDVVLKGETSPEKPSWVAYYTKGEEVLAVASMMKDPYMAQSAELMRRKKMPKKSEILKGVDVMEISIPAEVKI